MDKYSGAEWIEDARKYWKHSELPTSDLGRKVADLLGQVFRGIYHINKQASRVEWWHQKRISIIINNYNMATYDSGKLTELVFLCHLMNVRMDIEAAAYGYLRLSFCNVEKPGFLRDGHPTLDEAIAWSKNLLPEEKRV